MQNAPSVAYPVGRFSWPSRFALVGLALLGGVNVIGLAFVWPADGGLSPVLLLGVGWGLWLWSAGRQATLCPAGTLRWDAQAMGEGWAPGAGHWWWQEDGRAQPMPVRHLERRLDWGRGMLVRGRTEGRTRWFWLSASLAESRWGELRRAIEAQANTD